MNSIPTMALTPALSRILQDARAHCGFLSQARLAELAEADRLRMVLIRCGGGRFLCPAQDAAHFIDAIDGRDYVRDVSLPSSDPIFQDAPR